MQGLDLILLGYAAHVPGIMLLCGAGILYFRTRTIPTAMFFFGSAVTELQLLMFALFMSGSTEFSTFLSISELVGMLAMYIQSIGFLLYVISLPKQ
jgi:hypothetical protein